MPDCSIKQKDIDKGRFLELLIRRHLIDIVKNLRKNKIKCFFIHFEDVGGRGRSGTDFFLGIEFGGYSYWFFIEAKNLAEHSRSYADIEKKILHKFKTASDDLDVKIQNIVVGHFPISRANINLLKSKNIDYFDIGELSDFATPDEIIQFDDKLRGTLLANFASIDDMFSNQASEFELCVLNSHEILLKSNSKTIQKINIDDVLEKYVILENEKILDFFHISQSPHGRLLIKTPWKITSIPQLNTYNKKIGKILNHCKIMITPETCRRRYRQLEIIIN